LAEAIAGKGGGQTRHDHHVCGRDRIFAQARGDWFEKSAPGGGQ